MNNQIEYLKGFVNQKLKQYDIYYCYSSYDRNSYSYSLSEVYCYFTNSDYALQGDSIFTITWDSSYVLNLNYDTFTTRIKSQSVSGATETVYLSSTALNYSNIKGLRTADLSYSTLDMTDTNTLLTINCVGIFLVFFITVLFKLVRNRYGGLKYEKI